MVTRRTTYRLYPTPAQTVKLYEYRRLHCTLYNQALADRKDSYQRLGKNVSYFDQQNRLPEFKQVWPEFTPLGSHALQATLKRVDYSFSRFFKGLAKYPRFKSIRRYSGWTYPCKAGWSAQTNGKNGYLLISTIGRIGIRGRARTWGTPTTCTVLWRNGTWFASITVVCQPVREAGPGAIGVDFGCETAIALSSGTLISNPRRLIESGRQIRVASKALRRKRSPNHRKKIKASWRRLFSGRLCLPEKAAWRQAQKRISRLKRKVANQRQDFVHQQAAEIVRSNSLIATEKLEVKKMTRKAKSPKGRRQKAGLNRSILDMSFGMLRAAMEYKVIEAGGLLVEVPTKTVKPSQTCPECHRQQKKDLSERVHSCECGCVLNRDVAAAQVTRCATKLIRRKIPL